MATIPPDYNDLDEERDATKEFKREFQFVDAMDKKYRTQSRRHVSREVYRERRWNQIKHHNSQPPAPSSSMHPPKTHFMVSTTKFEPVKHEQKRHRGTSANAMGSQVCPKSSKELQTGLRPSINFLLGAGRVDPFRSYPIEATWEIHRLVDHYYVVIPSLLHKHWGRRITHPMPSMDLFEIYRRDEASFLGMLHHAARHLGRMYGVESETPEMIDFKLRTLNILKKRLVSSKGPYDDNTIVAAGLLANAERIWGDKDTARLHWDAVKLMISDHGGFQAFKGNHLVHTKLMWSFIALSGAPTLGSPIYVDTFTSSAAIEPHYLAAKKRNSSQSPFGLACAEFVQFFLNRRSAALHALPTSDADRRQLQRFPYRTKCFRPGTRMFETLSRIDTGYHSPDKRRAVENCRLASLIYLNAVVFEYGDFSAHTERFFRLFSQFVEDDDLDCTLSSEHLMWALVRGIEPHETYERTWMVSRMVGVMKRAGQKTWLEVEDALRMFLILPDDGAMLAASISKWDTRKFESEVMEFAKLEMLSIPQSPMNPRSGNHVDVLPETRDVRWFPDIEAAVESGVVPTQISASN